MVTKMVLRLHAAPDLSAKPGNLGRFMNGQIEKSETVFHTFMGSIFLFISLSLRNVCYSY